MNPDIDIRWSQRSDRDAILAFIEQMGFNPRDAATWDALDMRAMTAWQGGTLLGAIPIEPRPLRITPDKTVTTLHETVVAVHPDHRSRGLGSAMQAAIAADPIIDAQLLSVFREDPTSPAYRWYLKNGFTPAMHIDSWFWDGPSSPDANLDLSPAADPRLDYNLINGVWLTATDRFAGFVDRRQRPLPRWLSVHPYRARYQFQVLLDRRPDQTVPGYAILGIGKMHSLTERIDILDLTAVGSPQSLITKIQSLSANTGWRPIRWPLASTDPRVAVAVQAGFDKGWAFDMLVRPLGGFSLPSTAAWTYSGIDYI